MRHHIYSRKHSHDRDMDHSRASLRDLIFQKTWGESKTLDGYLCNFVSRQVREYCDSLKGSTIKPSINECFATIAIVDVSGFSKLAYSLAELSNGTHILAQTVKRYLDQVSEIIVDFSGDIIKFIGDALIVSWCLPYDHQDAETVYKAVSCCMTLLNELGSYKVDIETKTFKLGLHIALGSGKCHNLFVGDKRRFEHFFVGEAMNQVVNILDFAKLGELAISHDTLKIISTVIDLESLSIRAYDKNAVFLESQSFSRRAFRPFRSTLSAHKKHERGNKTAIKFMELFVDKSALSKFQADLDQSELFRLNNTFNDLIDIIEERQVTTVFIKVHLNIVDGPERLLEKSQSLTLTVLNSIQKWDGSLRQIHVDDKGAAMLCFFGLPPLAHDDDALRGLKMAIEIQSAFKKFQTKFSISVTTGLVSYCGIGCSVRAEYAVVGDAINIAARLMCHQLAKNSIACDEYTYNLCKQEFEFQEVQDVFLKGRAKSLVVYVPKFSVKHKVDNEGELKIIGRENEIQAINKILESAKKFNILERKSLIISGASGQGLSTLAEYVSDSCLKENIAHYVLESDLIESNNSFFAVSKFLLEIIDFLRHQKSEKEKENLNECSTYLGSTLDFKCTYSPAPSFAPSFSSRKENASFIKQPEDLYSGLDMEGRKSIFPSKVTEKEIMESLTRLGVENLFESFNLVQSLLKGLEGQSIESSYLASNVPQILKLLCAYLKHATEKSNFIFVLTNCHYIDDYSLEIFSQIIQSFGQISFIFFTKPFDKFDNISRKIFSNIEKLENVEKFVLKDFNQEECAQLALSLWPKSLATKVHPYISMIIFQKTKGNPFYTKLLIKCMKGAGHFSITNDGEIIVKGCFDHFKLWLKYDERRILPEFDRLDRFMQNFLKIASVLGDCFLLEDIVSVMGGCEIEKIKADIDHIAKQIHLDDPNRFLEIIPVRTGSGWSCQFRSEQVRISILNMIPIKKRQELHHLAATYYESKETQIDPKLILNHYQEAGPVYKPKVIQYLELVAGIYSSQKRYERALQYYKMLLNETSQAQIIITTKRKDHDRVRVVSTQLYSYAKCLYETNQITEAKSVLQECLKILGDKCTGNRICKRLLASYPKWFMAFLMCSKNATMFDSFEYSQAFIPIAPELEFDRSNLHFMSSASRDIGDTGNLRAIHIISSDLIRRKCYLLLAEIFFEEFDLEKLSYYAVKGLNSGCDDSHLLRDFFALYMFGNFLYKREICSRKELPVDGIFGDDTENFVYKLALISLYEGNVTKCQKLLSSNFRSPRLLSQTKLTSCIIHLYLQNAYELETSSRGILVDGDSNYDRLFFLSQSYLMRGNITLVQDCLFQMNRLKEKLGLKDKLYKLALLSLSASNNGVNENNQIFDEISETLQSFEKNSPWHTFIYLLPLVRSCLKYVTTNSGLHQKRLIGRFAKSCCSFLKKQYDFPLSRQVRKAFRGIQHISQGYPSRAISLWRNELQRYSDKDFSPTLIHQLIDSMEETDGKAVAMRNSAETLRTQRPSNA